jgi:hypothetical protein
MFPLATPAPTLADDPAHQRAERARRNGARSHGPVSPEGKARAAANARRYGFRSGEFWLMPDEDEGEFAALHARQARAFAPADEGQEALVQELVRALWKKARADRLEAVLLTDIFAAEGAEERLRLTRSLGTLVRYRARIERDHERALKALLAAKAHRAQAARNATPAPGAEPPAPRLAARTNEPGIAPPEPAAPSLNRAERRRLAALERQVKRRAA